MRYNVLGLPRRNLTQMYAARQKPAKNYPYSPCGTAAMAGRDTKERHMISKILSGAVIAGLLMAVSAPVVAYADDAAPKTKADCKKAAGKWDKKTKTCALKK